MSKLVIEAALRDVQAVKAKHLRDQGLVPINVYGKGVPPLSLVVGEREMDLTLRHGGASQLIEVQVAGGDTHNVLVKEIQRQPVGHRVLHVDMLAVRMDEKQHVSVPISRTGKPADSGSGFMTLQSLENVLIEALPGDIPATIEVDVSALTPENPIRVADLPQIEGVVYLVEEDEHVFAMVATRVSEEEEEAEELEGDESVEPEVVGRARDEDEEEE
jgi:large subunit ribosomal protein L25